MNFHQIFIEIATSTFFNGSKSVRPSSAISQKCMGQLV